MYGSTEVKDEIPLQENSTYQTVSTTTEEESVAQKSSISRDEYEGIARGESAELFLEAARKRAGKLLSEIVKEDIQFDQETIENVLASIGGEQLEEVLKYLKEDSTHARSVGWEVPKPVTYSFQKIYFRSSEDDVVYLNGISGVLNPGEMCVLLGAPDSQMDTLLRCLAGRTLSGTINGSIMIDGKNPGADFKQIITYVPKYEIHLPTITVQETVLTSYRLRMKEEVEDESIFLRMLLVLSAFGILHIRESTVGNKMVRGISGGERRRLSFCQEVGGFSSVLLADLPTNGLDSATAYNLCKTMRVLTHAWNYSLMFSLAQPSPELIDLFDTCLLLAKGYQIYYGPLNELMTYVGNMGYIKPELKSVPDFYQELTGDPSRFYHPELDNRDRDAEGYHTEPGTWQDLAEAWKRSKFYDALGQELWKGVNVDYEISIEPKPEETKNRLFQGVPDIQSTVWTQMRVLVYRQFLTVSRNFQYSRGRVAQNVLFSSVLGTIWLDIGFDTDDIVPRFGALFLMSIAQIFTVYPFIPFFCDLRTIHAFQVNSNYYYPPMFYISFMAVELCWLVPEVYVFSTIGYAIMDLQGTPMVNTKFYVFWLNLLIMKIISTGFALSLSCVLKGSSEKAHALYPVYLYLCILTSGYSTPQDKLKNVWLLISYINPLNYCWHSQCINEFYGLTFNTGYHWPEDFPKPETIAGEAMLSIYGLEVNDEQKKFYYTGMNVIIMVCVNILVILLTSFMTGEVYVPTMIVDEHEEHLHRVQDGGKTYQQQDGKRSPETEDKLLPVNANKQFTKLVDRILISWKDLSYYVQVWSEEQGGYKEKQILHDVFGFAQPGKMMALMGATGAGKSTLMDVLAGWKTGGRHTGEILVNGHPKNDFFPYMAGYVEQFDSHEESATVREAIEFSGRLRLPKNIDEDELQERVDDVLEKLELVPFAHKVIGNDFDGGISPEYRKKVTIAVELIMDPGLLFLDEPTTGLDSASAYNVMQCVKRLSDNMSVVCTIHQPSTEIFDVFDVMMLLKQGGRVCYFGPVSEMIQYFTDVELGEFDGVQNPADFALDCSYAKLVDGTDSADLYLGHERYSIAMKEYDEYNVGHPEPVVDMNMRPTYYTQVRALFWRNYARFFVTHLDETCLRVGCMLTIGIMLGWIFNGVDLSTRSAVSRTAVCFMCLGMTGFSAQMIIPIMLKQREYIFRERISNMYSMLPWVIARQAIEMPIQFVEAFCMTVPIHYMLPMKGSFWGYWLAWFCAYSANYSVVEFGTALAPSQEVADGVCAILNGGNICLGGYICNYDALPSFWKAMSYGSVLGYGFKAIAYNEWKDIGDLTFDEENSHHGGGDEFVLWTSGQDLIDYYNLDLFPYHVNIFICLGFLTFYKFATYLAAEHIQWVTR